MKNVAKSLLASVGIGLLWIPFAHVAYLKYSLPFSSSGILTGVWFLPAIFAAWLQSASNKSRFGLVFASESSAALISALWGPFGWMSFHFGLMQGLFAETAIQWAARKGNLRRAPWTVGIACSIADVFLLVVHPSLPANVHSLSAWIVHGAGVVASALLMVFLMGRFTKRVFVLLLASALPLNASASVKSCEHASAARVIAVDFDSTVVDTDRILLEQTVPAAALSFAQSPAQDTDLRNALRQALDTGRLPENYTDDAWTAAPSWNQLVAATGVGFREFWSRMSDFFSKQQQGTNIPIIPDFERFYRDMHRAESTQVPIHWLVVTARTRSATDPIRSTFAKLNPTPALLSILSRNDARGIDSDHNAFFKAHEMNRWEQETGLKIEAFLDNDARNLGQVKMSLAHVRLFRMSQEHRVVDF